MEKKKILKAEVEKVMDSSETKMFRKRLTNFFRTIKRIIKGEIKNEKNN